jgi:hypothetical protein
LSKREGVEILFVEPYKKYEIITDTQKIVGTGPVEILINKD